MLMLGTAVAAVLATGALAQDTSSSSSAMDSSSSSAMEASSSAMDNASSAMDSSAMSSQMSEASSQESSMMSTDTSSNVTSSRAPVDITAGYTQVDTDRLASKIIGSPVYDGPAADANNLGKINDLVLDQNGQVAAVVLGVGGFLGIAEKQVAVDFSALQWVVAADNTERWVLQTTKDQLTAAPDFKTVDDKPTDASNAAPADGTASSSAMDQATSSSSAAM
jgi:hypothetical protein